MTEKPTVVVFGATGFQGGAVVRALRGSGRWNVRAVTRKPADDAAVALDRSGVEVVRGDLDDPGVGAVLHGADALFVVTSFWEPQRDSDYVQGRRIIDAAVGAGIDNIVYSSLPGVSELSGGALPVPHADGKYELEKHLRGQGAPVAFVQPGWYYQNWLTLPQFRLRRSADGVITLANAAGDGCLPAVDIEDLGPVVAAIMDDPARFRGVTVPVIAELRTPAEYAEIFADRLGEPVRCQPIPREALLAGGEEGEHAANMFEFFRRYARDLWADAPGQAIVPRMRTFADWVDANAGAFHTLLKTGHCLQS